MNAERPAAFVRQLDECEVCGNRWLNDTGVCESCGAREWSLVESSLDQAIYFYDRPSGGGRWRG